MKRFAMILALTAVIALTVGSAQAALRMVPTQYATIQAAEDAAEPGDTILIRPGEYRESVTVDVAGLTIRGMTCARRSAVVDGGMGDTVFRIDSSDVTVACLTIRHGDSGIYADTGDGLAVDRVTILKSREYGIYIDNGDGFQIRGARIVASSSTGVWVGGGTGGRITGTSVRGAGSDCFYFGDADNLLFEENSARTCNGYGVEISGSTTTVRNNKFLANQRGLYVSGDDNQIEENTLASSCYTDDALYVSGSNNTIDSNTVTNCYYNAISTDGDGNQILDNVIRGVSDDYCFNLYGEDTVATGNQCTSAYYGLYSDGDRAEIRENTIDGALYEPIYVYGSDVEIVNNQVSHAYEGFDVYGDNALIESNSVTSSTWDSFYIDGQNPRVLDNRADSGSPTAFYVYCWSDCSTAEVSGNVGANVVGYGRFRADPNMAGFLLYAETSGMTIANNTSTGNQGFGMDIRTDGASISSNVARLNGSVDGARAGFVLRGNDNTVTANEAIDNTGPGFEIRGSGNELSENVARGNMLEGFIIQTGYEGNILSQNFARANQAEGIDNQGDDTELSSNTSTGNRTDCTSDGSVYSMTGNLCNDQSDFAMTSEIDLELN